MTWRESGRSPILAGSFEIPTFSGPPSFLEDLEVGRSMISPGSPSLLVAFLLFQRNCPHLFLLQLLIPFHFSRKTVFGE